MKKLDLFKSKKRALMSMIAFSTIACLSIYFKFPFNESKILSFSVFFACILQFSFQLVEISRYYFIIDRGYIRWKMLYMSTELTIELTQDISDIRNSWKGIYFKCGNKQHCILTDGLSKKQKQRIVEELIATEIVFHNPILTDNN